MLIFNEGVPRAGKSYDAVKEHILPALKKGRKVFARLDGLDHEAIAVHLGMNVDDVRELLVLVSSDDVPRLAELTAGYPGCLAVVDECHKYYVQSMRPLPPGVEDFFAEHGHAGMDILLISQWYKRLHTALRARVERKNVFQKLTAVGMTNSYLVTYWHTTGPDKFEQVGKAKKKYDPAIFPLYHGFLPEAADNTDVYSEGSITVWRTVLPYFILASVLLLIGAFFYVRFFTSSGGAAKKPAPVAAAAAASPAVSAMPSPAQLPKPAQAAAQAAVKPKRPDMPPEAAYLWGLQDQGKARLAGAAIMEDGQFDGVIEWRADKSRVLDSLTVGQIRSMGVTVERKPFGALLTWGKGKDLQTIVVTAWPLDEPQRYSRQDVQNIRDASPVIAQGTAGAYGDTSAISGGSAASDRHSERATASPYVPPTYAAWNSDPFGGGSKR